MAFADAQANAVVVPVGDNGISTVVITGTVTKGDAIGFSSGWKRALATTGSVVQMRCVALEDGVDGQRIAVCFGECYIRGGRFSGGTANGALYVAEGSSSGQYTQTVPSTSGDATTRVGTMLSATEAIITPNYNVDSTAT
jgi:hypothetical protein